MNTNREMKTTETTTTDAWLPESSSGYTELERAAPKEGAALAVTLEEREERSRNRVDEIVLYRALERAGYRPTRPNYAAEAWQRVINFRIRYKVNDRTHVLEADRDGAQGKMPASRDRILHNADCIEVEAELENAAGYRMRMTLPVEFAVVNNAHASWIDDAGLIFSRATRLWPEPSADPEHLVDLLEHALFQPWSADDEETVSQQRENFRATALDMLDDGLLKRADALQRMAERRYGYSYGLKLQPGERIEVHIREDEGGTHIKVESSTAEPATTSST